MIRLDVEDYCHSCNAFKPEIMEECVTLNYSNGRCETYGDTVIGCKKREFCNRMRDHFVRYAEAIRATGKEE